MHCLHGLKSKNEVLLPECLLAGCPSDALMYVIHSRESSSACPLSVTSTWDGTGVACSCPARSSLCRILNDPCSCQLYPVCVYIRVMIWAGDMSGGVVHLASRRWQLDTVKHARHSNTQLGLNIPSRKHPPGILVLNEVWIIHVIHEYDDMEVCSTCR